MVVEEGTDALTPPAHDMQTEIDEVSAGPLAHGYLEEGTLRRETRHGGWLPVYHAAPDALRPTISSSVRPASASSASVCWP